jgi:biopolymer transport protein ExbD
MPLNGMQLIFAYLPMFMITKNKLRKILSITFPTKHSKFKLLAPEEQVEQAQQQQQIVVRPQKHYKIIFVKAPSYPTQSQAQLQAQSKTEEKTLVYVLVKKPEEVSQDQQDQQEDSFVPRYIFD